MRIIVRKERHKIYFYHLMVSNKTIRINYKKYIRNA